MSFLVARQSRDQSGALVDMRPVRRFRTERGARNFAKRWASELYGHGPFLIEVRSTRANALGLYVIATYTPRTVRESQRKHKNPRAP